MAKDYKHTAKTKSKKSQSASCWGAMFTGLALGLFVAFLVYVREHAPETAVDGKAAPVVDKGSPAESKDKKETNQAQTPRFDFYNLLPEMEVFIPDQEIAAEREKTASDQDVIYYLQVGSFRHFEDADRLRAQLALLSLESHTQRVTIDGKQTWHRVRVGPFTSAREMGKVRVRLQDQSMNPIVLKVKK
ncbi:SPOR domain-containing protein [Kaarinaea lacus]